MIEYYLGLKEKFKKGELFDPPLIHLLVTNTCNLNCRHCFAADSTNNIKENVDLSFDEYKKISDSMGRIGMMMVCGGEPFLKKDLTDIVKLFIKNNNVSKIGLSTNGYAWRQTIPKVEQLVAETDINYSLVFSVDGVKDTHDFIRDHEKRKSFDKLMVTWEKAKKLESQYPNLSVELSSVVNKYNHEQLDDMYDLFTNTMEASHIGVLYVRQEQWDKDIKSDISLENYRHYTQRIEDWVYKTAKPKDYLSALFKSSQLLMYRIIYDTLKSGEVYMPCVAGKASVLFDNMGGIYSCEVRKEVAKLRDNDYDFKKIFYSEAMDTERKAVEVCEHFPCTHETEYLGPSIPFSLPEHRESELFEIFSRFQPHLETA
ncbi:radical SAM protein [Teredinibacter purpureus]|uniref:radical SAM protein n=1 Tax=Teredinibacter purpureus TaxID=2731756 RepID=UPI0005F800EF|nr:radical SAM protein [Teredinibacter purpureus]